MVIFFKKGVETSLVVGMIVLVASVVIIFVFISNQDWTGSIDKQTCHTSVVLRGTASSVSSLAEDVIQLKCKTSKICLTSGLIGGKCDNDFKNSDDVKKVKVNSKEDVEKTISQQIVDCWDMMGEGKLSLFTQYWAQSGLGPVYPTCVICSRISFDDKLSVSNPDLNKVNLLNYMMTHKMPGKDISYYSYLVQQEGKIDVSKGITVKDILTNSDGSPKTDADKNIETSNLYSINPGDVEILQPSQPKEEMAIVFTQISAPTGGQARMNVLQAIGIGTASSLFFAGPITTVKKVVGVGTAIVGSGLPGVVAMIGGTIIIGATQQWNVEANRYAAFGYCGDISGQNGRNGCSVVRAVNYNLEDISKYCSAIESIN
jgi:hypothetical protein